MYVNCSFSYTCHILRYTKPCLAAAFGLGISVGESGKQCKNMLKNYFVIGWRNLMKHKLFSFINIAGLGIAIPFSLLCLIQVVVVFEADNFHPYPGRTYRIITVVKAANGSKT